MSFAMLVATSATTLQDCGESTRSCIADSGTSFASRPSKPRPCAGCSGILSCMESGMSSGVICRFRSGLGGARKLLLLGLLGLSSFSKTESRFFDVVSSVGRV